MNRIHLYTLTLFLLLQNVSKVFADHCIGKPYKYHTPEVPTTSVPFADIGKLVGNIFTISIVLGSILLFLYLILGGVQWMTSGGDKIATQAARERITAALTGLLIILAIWGVFRILEAAFGISVIGGINFPSAVTSPFSADPAPCL